MTTSLFAAPLAVPIFRWADANGAPLNGGKLETYVAGTATPLATYPTYVDALAGSNANANPVILDANGAAQVWVQASLYKFVIRDSANVLLYTQDNVGVALGYPQPFPTEWVTESRAVTFTGATTFLVTGVNATSTYHVGRRIKSNNIGGLVYSTVRAVTFAVDTTVTVVNDGAGVLDAGFANLFYGLLSYDFPSYLDPRSFFTARLTANQTGFAATTKLAGWTVVRDNNSEWVAGTNRWVCKYPGQYLVTLQAEHSNTVASINAVLQIDVNAVVVGQATGRAYSVATNITSLMAHYGAQLAIGDFVEGFFLGDANTTVVGGVGTRLSVVRTP